MFFFAFAFLIAKKKLGAPLNKFMMYRCIYFFLLKLLSSALDYNLVFSTNFLFPSLNNNTLCESHWRKVWLLQHLGFEQKHLTAKITGRESKVQNILFKPTARVAIIP